MKSTARRAAITAVAVIVPLLAACSSTASAPPPEPTAEEFLAEWTSGDLAAAAALTDNSAAAKTGLTEFGKAVKAGAITTKIGTVTTKGKHATVDFTATVKIGNLGSWDYNGALTLDLISQDGQKRWQLPWSTAQLNPALTDGKQIVTSVDPAPAAGVVVDASGKPLSDGPAGFQQPWLGTKAHGDAKATGLYATYAAQLTGTGGGKVALVDAAGNPVSTLTEFSGKAATNVTTTLDPTVQNAAELALSSSAPAGKLAALVVVRASTGQVLAVANAPISGFNRALVGHYPPGSDFKLVTSYALVGAGLTPDSPVSCSGTYDVGGHSFKDADGDPVGQFPFSKAFALSCNTAFISQMDSVRGGKMVDAASMFGIGGAWKVPGIDAYTGSYPDPGSDGVALAASMIGQGQVEVSPLGMAEVAAAIASGTYHSPSIVTSPAPAGTVSKPLDLQVVGQLRTLMLGPVRDPDGTAHKQWQGYPGEVHGKTGTAEYIGTKINGQLPVHGWFVGYEGDIAFAAIVEDSDGSSGATVAAPICRNLLERLTAAKYNLG